MVVKVHDRKFRQQRVAMVAVVVHRVAPVRKLRPDSVCQKFVVRRLREVGNTARMAMVGAQHLLQKYYVRPDCSYRITQLVQHEAAVEGGEAFVHVHGENLEGQWLGGRGG